MAIRIINEPDIVLTRSEYERLYREWESHQQYTAAPTSFETWLRSRQVRTGNVIRDAFAEKGGER